MEVYGFLQAAYAHQQTSALIIRGISDLINNKHEADTAHFQEIASRHASAFAFQMLASLIRPDEHPSDVSLEREPGEMLPLLIMEPSRALLFMKTMVFNTFIKQWRIHPRKSLLMERSTSNEDASLCNKETILLPDSILPKRRACWMKSGFR
jgi:hypothetical protein